METTLEVRWFVQGMPPAVVQRWFKLECSGKILDNEPETREDLYACKIKENIGQIKAIAPSFSERASINLKLRQSKLELKLRVQELQAQKFGHDNNSAIWSGNVEQWHKLTEREIVDYNFPIPKVIPTTNWISVIKRRERKVEQGVNSELTWLKIDGSHWWTVAFEMVNRNNYKQQDSCFKKVIDRACQSYYGPKLSLENSYSYSQWLLKLYPQKMLEDQLNFNSENSYLTKKNSVTEN